MPDVAAPAAHPTDGATPIPVSVDGGLHVVAWDLPGPRPDAPVLFLSNGLGGNFPSWRHLLRAFGATHRIVSWDYRGLYASRLPESERDTADVSVAAHLRDALAVADALGVQRAVWVGWSMGVQLNFDLAARHPERVEGLVALAGGFGRPLRTTVLGSLGEPAILPGMDAAVRLVPRFGGSLRQVLRHPLFLTIAERLGAVGPGLDRDLYGELVDAFLGLDFQVYNRIMASLGEHDVEDRLPSIAAPTLVMAGDRDPMTPLWLSRRMADVLPDAVLQILPRGSHYVPVEQPARINGHVARFLSERLGHSVAPGLVSATAP